MNCRSGSAASPYPAERMQRIIGIESPDASWLVIATGKSNRFASAVGFYKTILREILAEMWDSDSETMSQIDAVIKNSSPEKIELNHAQSRIDAILQMFQGFELNGEPTEHPSIEIQTIEELLCFHNEWNMFSLVISNPNSHTLFVWETTA